MSLSIVPLTPDRLPQMAQVMTAALERPLALARFKQKYLVGGDAGPAYGFILLDGARPVGVCGAIPYRYVTPDGQDVVAAQYSDFGLLKDYRGGRVFRELTSRLHEESRTRGAAFSFALTSEGSRAAMVRGMAHVTHGDIHAFEFRLSDRTGIFARATDRAWRSVGWRFAAYHAAPAPSADAGLCRAERGDAFVRVRLRNGIRFACIQGHPVMLRPGAVTSVALPETLEPAQLAPLLAELGQRARRAGTRTLRFLLGEKDPVLSEMTRLVGPSLGHLAMCSRIMDDRLTLDMLSYGYADYEGF